MSRILSGEGEVLIQRLTPAAVPSRFRGADAGSQNIHFSRNLHPHIQIEKGCKKAEVLGCSGLIRSRSRTKLAIDRTFLAIVDPRTRSRPANVKVRDEWGIEDDAARAPLGRRRSGSPRRRPGVSYVASS